MSEFENHEGNGTAVSGGFEADDNVGRGGEIEDQSDSKYQVLFLLFDCATVFHFPIV